MGSKPDGCTVLIVAPGPCERTFAILTPVDRYELERFRRSLAMLTPGQLALHREEALAVLAELERVQQRLELRPYAFKWGELAGWRPQPRRPR